MQEKTPLVSVFDFTLSSPACRPGADSWSVRMTFDADIADALPLLNAELDGADYDHKAKCLIWKGPKKRYAFRPQEICIGPVEDRDEVYPMCRDAAAIVNRAWARRTDIEPDYSGNEEPPPLMEIYATLPKDNCGRCGYPTCMAFAAAYRSGDAGAADCPRADLNGG